MVVVLAVGSVAAQLAAGAGRPIVAVKAATAPDFALSVSGGPTMNPGTSGTFTVSVIPLNGETSPISVSVAAPEAPVVPPSAAFTYPYHPATFTMSPPAQIGGGVYQATVAGADAANQQAHTLSFNYTVTGSPANFSLSASPNPLTVNSGASGTVNIGLGAVNGLNSDIQLAVVPESTLPVQPVPQWNGLAPVTDVSPPYPGQRLVFTTAPGTDNGTYTYEVTATSYNSRAIAALLQIQVNVVNGPDFTLSASGGPSLNQGMSGTFTAQVHANAAETRPITIYPSIGFEIGDYVTPSSIVSLPPYAPVSFTVSSNAHVPPTAGSYGVLVDAIDPTGLIRNVTNTYSKSSLLADFNLGASPSSISIAQGQSGSVNIGVGAVNGMNGDVQMVATPVPNPAQLMAPAPKWRRNPNLATDVAAPYAAETLDFIVAPSASVGTYHYTVTGTSPNAASTTKSIDVSVNVVAGVNAVPSPPMVSPPPVSPPPVNPPPVGPPASWTGSGVFYGNHDASLTNGVNGSLTFTPAAAIGTLSLSGCTLTLPASGLGVFVRSLDQVSPARIAAGYPAYDRYSGTAVIAPDCPMFIPGGSVKATINHYTQAAFSDAISGWLEAVDQSPTGVRTSLTSYPAQRVFFLASPSPAYISAIVGGLQNTLQAGLQSFSLGSDGLSTPTVNLGNVSQVLTPVAQPTTDAPSTASTSSDAKNCFQGDCRHEVSFYHGPTMGNIFYNNGTPQSIDPTHYLDFHFSSIPIIPQYQMTPQCTTDCYSLGDTAAANTSLAYPKDSPGFIKYFELGSWLPPAIFKPGASDGGDDVEQVEYDFRWDPNFFQLAAGTDNPNSQTAAQRTPSTFSAGLDFGQFEVGPLEWSPLGLHVSYSPSADDQSNASQTVSGDQNVQSGEVYWRLRPEPYSARPTSASSALGAQIGLEEVGYPQNGETTDTYGWGAMTYQEYRCSDGTSYPCPNSRPYPVQHYLTSNPSGDTKNPSIGTHIDVTAGDVALDSFSWNARNVDGSTAQPPAPNGKYQGWIVGSPGPAVCYNGLVYADNACQPWTTIGTNAQLTEFFIGYDGQQRVNSSHCVIAKIVDLSTNSPHKDVTTSKTLCGITQANRQLWVGLPSLTDTSVHEIQLWDQLEYDSQFPTGITQRVPLATFDFGVQPCPLMNSGSPGYFNCPRD
ncbi:MAG TPA: hypothetical protein VG245_07895 [Candidatus Dormibacteraeota bacterium]|jgi:hypothetical protein|nr:hypothetical protein [Candidatus Dormibacteraeota bacterium]